MSCRPGVLAVLVVALSLTVVPSALAAGSSDLAVTQSGSPDPVAAGQYVSYGLSVTNNGPDPATNVTVTDPLPAHTQYVTDDSRCSYASGPNTITCALGTLPAGGNAVVEIVLRLTDFSFHGTLHNVVTVSSDSTDPNPADNTASFSSHVFNNSHDHHITVSKNEQQVDFDPGQTRTVTLSCSNPADTMVDGSLRVDNVDQGTGTLRSVVVTEQKAVGNGYEFTATNTATGRAQTKVFGTCLPATTEPAGTPSHTHPFAYEPIQTVTMAAPTAGHYDIQVPCNSPNFVAVTSPGFEFTGGGQGEQVSSEPSFDGSGKPAWTFGFDVTTPGSITASIRCVDRYLGTTNGHTHELWLSHPDVTVTVPPNAPAGGTYSIDCSDEAKGIVASYDLPPGVHLVGHDPQPKRRSFKLVNETAGPLDVHLDLFCIGDRTGTDPPPPAAPAKVRTTARTAASGASVGVGVVCPSGGCSGTVTLLAPAAKGRAVSAASKVIGSVMFLSRRAGAYTARVSVAKRYRRAIRTGRLRKVTAVVRKIDGTVARRVTIRLRH